MKIKKPVYEVIQQAHDALDIVNVWVEDTAMVVRTLTEVAEDETTTAETIYTEDDLKVVGKIFPSELFSAQYRYYFNIGGSYYRLLSEDVFDIGQERTYQKDIYVGGANIIFGYRHYGFAKVRPTFLPPFDIRSATNRKYKDNEFLHIEGVDVVCALYCRDENDSMKDCAFEIFHDKNAKLITNLTPTVFETLPITKYKFFHRRYHGTEEQFIVSLPEGMEKIPANSEVELTVTAKCFPSDAPRYMRTPDIALAVDDTEFNGQRILVANGGYIPSRYLNFKDGVAKVRFCSDRMQSGDSVQFHIESNANQYVANPVIFEIE